MRARYTAFRVQRVTSTSSLPVSSYPVDLEDAIDSLRRRGQFNVIDYATGWKVDFIIPPFEEFNVEEFERRQIFEVGNLQLSVVSPEDIVIAKLLWARAGQSERQLEDAAAVVRFQAENFDQSYVEKWVHRLELEQEWTSVRARAAN